MNETNVCKVLNKDSSSRYLLGFVVMNWRDHIGKSVLKRKVESIC